MDLPHTSGALTRADKWVIFFFFRKADSAAALCAYALEERVIRTVVLHPIDIAWAFFAKAPGSAVFLRQVHGNLLVAVLVQADMRDRIVVLQVYQRVDIRRGDVIRFRYHINVSNILRIHTRDIQNLVSPMLIQSIQIRRTIHLWLNLWLRIVRRIVTRCVLDSSAFVVGHLRLYDYSLLGEHHGR